MKTALNYLIIVIATALLQFVMPWWIIALVPFVVYLVRPEKPAIAYAVSLAAVSTVWATYALFLHNATQGSMSNRIAEIFYLPNATMLLTAVSLLSGFVAGFGGSAGALVRQVFVKEAA
jgi:hypothetical protein